MPSTSSFLLNPTLDKSDPPFLIIYDGLLRTCDKHNALHQISLSWMVLRDTGMDIDEQGVYHLSSIYKQNSVMPSL